MKYHDRELDCHCFFWTGKKLELECYYMKNTKDQTFEKGIVVKSESVEL